MSPPWSKEDDALLRKLWEEKWSTLRMSTALDRSVSAIYTRSRRLNLPYRRNIEDPIKRHVTCDFTLPPDLHNKLKTRAKEYKVTQATYIRNVLRTHFAKEGL